MIWDSAFFQCISLMDVIFRSDSRIKMIYEFQRCKLLGRIVIPASVSFIGRRAFIRCTSLSKVTFQSDPRIKVIYGFQACKALRRIEIPTSVESIGGDAFSGGSSNRELIFGSGTQIRKVYDPDTIRAFVVYMEDNDIKQRRSRIHMNIPGLIVPRKAGLPWIAPN
jgi:hypothetical protein